MAIKMYPMAGVLLLVGTLGCVDNKVESRLGALETGQNEAIARDQKQSADLDEIKTKAQTIQTQLDTLAKSLESISAELAKIDKELAESRAFAGRFAEAMRNRPANAPGAGGDERPQPGEMVEKLLERHAGALGLDDKQRQVLGDHLRRTMMSLLPTMMQARQGNMSREDAEKALQDAISKMADDLQQDGTLTSEQIDQIRRGLPDALRRMQPGQGK